MRFPSPLTACIRHLHRSLLHLFYPSQCLHCHLPLHPHAPVLCSACASLLDLIPIEGRCKRCFLLEEQTMNRHYCSQCNLTPPLYYRMAAAFDYEGPAATLVRALKYGGQTHLAEGMGAFLATQFEQLGWPLPDALVPVPLSPFRLWERRYNQSQLLAEVLGDFLNRPVWSVLRRRHGGASQAALPLSMRQQLDSTLFYWKDSSQSINDKILLVIDDVMTSGATLNCCAERLYEHRPRLLYALAFCHA